jgi:hypothetical protein
MDRTTAKKRQEPVTHTLAQTKIVTITLIQSHRSQQEDATWVEDGSWANGHRSLRSQCVPSDHQAGNLQRHRTCTIKWIQTPCCRRTAHSLLVRNFSFLFRTRPLASYCCGTARIYSHRYTINMVAFCPRLNRTFALLHTGSVHLPMMDQVSGNSTLCWFRSWKALADFAHLPRQPSC